MKATRDSGICMKLDDSTGVLSLERLEVNTMVYLYSEQGELIGKIHSTGDCVTFYIAEKRHVCACYSLCILSGGGQEDHLLNFQEREKPVYHKAYRQIAIVYRFSIL